MTQAALRGMKGLWRAWLWLGKRLGEVYAAILLTAVYALIIGFYAALYRLFGRSHADGQWQPKQTADASREAMRRQY